MIFAKVDVDLRDHARAHKAGPAMATWLWALLYVRAQESDGFVPSVALRGAWVGDEQARRDAAELVRVGLFRFDLRREGWHVLKYAAKNETANTIAERREEARQRMMRVRTNRKACSREPQVSQQSEVPGSDSVSGSDLKSREGMQGETGPPDWWTGACDAAAMVAGDVSDRPARWVSYRASRSRKTWAMNHEDAVGWLADVVRRERSQQPVRAEGGASPRARRDLTGFRP